MGDRKDIAKFVIPAAIAWWLVGIAVSRDGVPDWVVATASGVMGVSVVVLLAFLIVRQSGWLQLVRRYPGDADRPAQWKTCRSAVISAVSRDSADFVRRRLRLAFILRVDADERALHLSAPALIGWLLPPISIPWSATAGVRRFDASGWVTPLTEPGTIFNATYDPGYRGTFLEIEVAEPKWFLQVPAELLSGFPAVDPAAARR